MGQVFSDYLRALGPGGEPPDPRAFTELWRALRERLRRELRRRGLWESSPSFLGIDGWSRWEEGAGGEAADALDELVASCYTYVFLERLRSLRAQLRVKPDVEGLIVRSVRNFLHDTQRRRDPLGYRVFVMLRAALEACLASGRLRVAQGGPKIANDTVFAFVPDASPAEESQLRQLVPAWNDQLLPELVTGRGEAEKEVRERLTELVLGLSAQGVEAFVFRHVIDPLKLDVRARWAALLGEEIGEGDTDEAPGELARLMRSIGPDAGYEERESFERLVDCVSEGLERLQGQLRQKTHRYLLSLWEFLRVFAAGAAELPSQRQLAQLLGIPRERLPELFSSLGEVVERCLPPGAVNPALGSVWRVRSAPQKGGVMALQDLQEGLRLQTAEALRRELARESETGSAGGPRVGDVFALPESADAGALWVLVASAPGRSARFLALPADTQPVRGSADVAVPGAPGEAPLTLRGRCATWLDAERLSGGSRVRTVGEETLAKAREKHAAFAADRLLGTAIEREVEADPEYQDWMEELGALTAQLGTAEPRRAATPVARRAPVRWTSVDNPWAIAASILLVVGLGLGGGLWREQTQRGALESRLEQTENERRLELEQHAAKVGALEAQIAELESRPIPGDGGGPLFNLVRVTLAASGTERGDGERVELTPSATSVQLSLTLPTTEPAGNRYRLEILEHATGKKHKLDGPPLVDVEGFGELSLVLQRNDLRSGKYLLLLYREGEASSEPVAKYAVEIVFKK